MISFLFDNAMTVAQLLNLTWAANIENIRTWTCPRLQSLDKAEDIPVLCASEIKKYKHRKWLVVSPGQVNANKDIVWRVP